MARRPTRRALPTTARDRRTTLLPDRSLSEPIHHRPRLDPVGMRGHRSIQTPEPGASHIRCHAGRIRPSVWLGVARCRMPCYSQAVTRTIPQRELRNENAKVIEAVTAGETFIITRNGEPVAELRPTMARRRTFIPRAEVAGLAITGVRIDRHRFRADLDRLIDQDP